MFKSQLRPVEKLLAGGLFAVAYVLLAITLLSPNHGWVTPAGKVAQSAAESRTSYDPALVASQP